MPRWITLLFLLPFLSALPETRAVAAEPPAAGTLLLIDAAGKEQKLKAWQFVHGTRRLTWLAPLAAPPKEGGDPRPTQPGATARPAMGPEALEFRDENSTDFVNGIVTLLPLEHLRAVEFDNDKKTVRALVATGEKPDAGEVLAGTTRFQGINKLTIEAEVDKGELGIAQIKFQGGVPRGIRAVRFPAPRPAPQVKGRPATLTVADREKKNVQTVVDLQVLYRMEDGSERVSPLLMFKKTLKLDVGKIQKLVAGEGRDMEGTEWQVTLKDGEEHTLTLLKATTIDGRPAALEGFLGKVRGGYRLFPVHTLTEVQLDEAKKPEKSESKP
jgi:hypothetical protein